MAVLPAASAVTRSNAMDRTYLAPLRPVVIGPKAGLHRYAVAAERALLGTYNKSADTAYAYPNKAAGSVVDLASVKVYADAADLNYFNKYTGLNGSCQPDATYPNRVRAANYTFVTANGATRTADFGDRDVKAGDVVQVRGVVSGNPVTVNSVVTGFLGEPVASTRGTATADAGNKGNVAAAVSVSQVAGTPINDVVVTADGSLYDSAVDGYLTRTYTVTVTQSSTGSNATTGRLRVQSADGGDDVASVTPAAFGAPTAIGTRGLTSTFAIDGAHSSASLFGIVEQDFVIGQQWTVTVSQLFTAPTATAAGTYTGLADDTYLVKVTRGGAYAGVTPPQITVTTANGSDASGPTSVTAAATPVAVGNHGVTIAFNQTKLAAGDQYYVTVTAAAQGAVKTLLLRDDCPAGLLGTEVDLRLFARRSGVLVPATRTLPAPGTDWTADAAGLTLKAGVYLTDAEFTSGGVAVGVPLETATLYAEYREWLADGAATVVSVARRADVAGLLGPVDPTNPVAAAADAALANTYGALVTDPTNPGRDTTDVVLAVSIAGDPADAALWQAALDAVEATDDAYDLVLASADPAVQALGVAHVAARSTDAVGFYRRLLVPATLAETGAVVSPATTSDNLTATVTVAATPGTSPTKYTTVTGSANAKFVTNGVRAGDKLRTNYGLAADGVTETYDEYAVASVTSETTLVLATGPTGAVTVARRAEVWRTYTKAELVAQLTAKAAAYAGHDGRVMYVWPDRASFGGTLVDGPSVCAAVAGLAGSVPSHQGLRNVGLAGVDDVSRAKGLFTDAQLNQLAAGGVLVVSEASDGTPYVRAAVSADVAATETREEMMVRNADMVRKAIQAAWNPYVGAGNVVSNLRPLLDGALQSLAQKLKSASYSEGLGAPVSALNLTSIATVPGHADRVAVTVVPTGLAVPLNAIQLTLPVTA